MFSKVATLLCVVAVASAQVYQSTYPVAAQTYVHDSPHVGLQSEQTVRGFAGSSISHQQKAIDSAFSSVRKTDTRITNPQLYAAAPAIAAPVYQHTYAAAPVAAVAAPAYAAQAYAAPAYAAQAYAAPAYAAPQVFSKTYAPAPVRAFATAPVYQTAAYPAYQQTYAHAPLAAAPLLAKTAPVYAAAPAPLAYAAAPAPLAYAHAPAVAKVASPLLGVQYSAVSPAVATLNFNGYGISYGY